MKVICFGDSNTYGYENLSYIGGRYNSDSRWVDLLARKTGWSVINEGQNGRVIPRNPIHVPEDTNLLIVMLGTNDILQGASAITTAKRMETFLLSLQIESKSILLVAPPPLTFGVWVPDELLIKESIALSEQYRSLAERFGISYVDTREWNVSLVFDGVHFSADGHRTFADELYQYLCDDVYYRKMIYAI